MKKSTDQICVCIYKGVVSVSSFFFIAIVDDDDDVGVIMSFYCGRCDRYFRWKVGLQRHMERKRPCRKAMYSCSDCNRVFVSTQSLGKHKTLYCKFKPVLVKEEVPAIENTSSATLSDLLDALYNRDHQHLPATTEIDPTTTFSDLLSTLMPSPSSPPPPYDEQVLAAAAAAAAADIKQDDNPFEAAFSEAIQQQQQQQQQPADEPILYSFNEQHQQEQEQEQQPADKPILYRFDEQQQPADEPNIYSFFDQQQQPADDEPNNILYRFDDMLMQWMNEIIRMEGNFRNTATVKGEVAKVLDRMLQDGLISMHEHGQMIYTNQLFVRLHDLIHMNMHSLNRREIMDILVNIFEMGKITKTVFVEMCINI